MKVNRNAQRLIEYLREHQPATVARMVLDGVLNAPDASNAIHYGVRRGVFERVAHPGAGPGERPQYRLTGQPLHLSKSVASAPSFDALLAAWGITSASPEWPDERKQLVMVE
ncbi:hypothetical protein [Paraburkholderia sp. CI3]|uniref:hypothetical protein n=1 Tax=Paraburkholderia sp. CI3 TaxID=2991060 RepID=UPI003D20BD42